ncbi:MAG: ATP-grasp domain-containing protein [Verrucomicrobia bacterium]|nr:ATP-grasp domain-containing protein [Verrucomicrobiota bacterium]
MSNYFIVNSKSLTPAYPVDNQWLEEDSISELLFQDGDKICINSEACLQAVYERVGEGPRKRAIDLFKNKFLFRSALAEQFPNFQFHQTTLSDLKPVDRKSVLKPVKGFFSAGVRILSPEDDISELKREISAEMKNYGQYFSESVLSTEEWMVEEYIDGEEIAVDLFYSGDGTPVILNIAQHPMPSDLHYLNAVYWTSRSLFQQWQKPLEQFFSKLNSEILSVTHFPLHAEFRVQGDRLIPIEINPLRFGGFGLADLAYYSFGFNPYDLFFQDSSPNWEEIWSRSQKEFYCWALAYNGKAIDVNRSVPNHESFIEFCGKENMAFYRQMNWKTQPVFAIAYLALADDRVIRELLSADFNRFFLQPRRPSFSSAGRRAGTRSRRRGLRKKRCSSLR